MLFPKIPSNFFFKQSTKNNANIPKIHHNTLTKNYLNRKNEKIILSKSIAFAISSPIDTVRQNILTKNTIKPSRIIKSIPHGFIASFLISLPCHTTINILENTIDNEIFAIILGVLVANTIKIPIIYNYKKVRDTLIGVLQRICDHIHVDITLLLCNVLDHIDQTQFSRDESIVEDLDTFALIPGADHIAWIVDHHRTIEVNQFSGITSL